MTNYLAPTMEKNEMEALGSLGLAHIGDAVFELMTRTFLCKSGKATAASLHRETVKRVQAKAQAKAGALIQTLLTEPEAAVYRRGRNTRVNGIPKGANPAEYHAATALEALFGWLYLRGETARLNELYHYIITEVNHAS